MKIKLLCARAGNPGPNKDGSPQRDFSNIPGDIVDVPTREAETLIAAGSAEAATGPKARMATKEPPENAQSKRGAGKSKAK